MTTKFVSLVAVVVFSFSAFAQKAREIAPETKAKMESISKLKGKEANDQIIKDLLNAEYKGKAQEKLQSGLDSIFGKEEILAKVEFAGRLKTLLESSDVSTKNAGRHMRGLLERFSDMNDPAIQDVVKRLLKNSDISMSEVSSTYEAQLAATNLLTYKLFVKGIKEIDGAGGKKEAIDANTIELVGIANVMKSELPGIKTEGKTSEVITSLKELTNEQRKAVELKRDEWKTKCNS